jgi:hypothetical protein
MGADNKHRVQCMGFAILRRFIAHLCDFEAIERAKDDPFGAGAGDAARVEQDAAQASDNHACPIFVFSLTNRHISALCCNRLSDGGLSMSDVAFAFFAITPSTVSVALAAALVFSF